MSLQEQAKALGDPTRHRIFRHIADTDGPIGVAELTSQFALNHNAIRQHLAKLVNAGLITQETGSRMKPGRPPLLFRVNPMADSRWGTKGPYHRLSLLLVDMISSGATAEEVGRRTGRELKVRSADSTEERLTALGEAIARGGFDPKMRRQGDALVYDLANCPFADAAEADPETVCGLHLGLAQGLADQIHDLTVDDLIRSDPHHGGCKLVVHLSTPASEQTMA